MKFLISSPTYGDHFVLIDKTDEYLIEKYTWRIVKTNGNFYVRTWSPMINGKREIIQLHNLILGIKNVDHKNGNGLDNRRKNLRPCTYITNGQNRRPRTDKNKTGSKYKGVIKNNQVKKESWLARIHVNKRFVHIGSFSTETEAAKAYNKAAKKYFGEFAKLNEV